MLWPPISPSSYDQLLARFGATPAIDGTHFSVWALKTRELQMMLQDSVSHRLLPVDGKGPFPDSLLALSRGRQWTLLWNSERLECAVELPPISPLHRMAGTSQKKQHFYSLQLRLYDPRASSSPGRTLHHPITKNYETSISTQTTRQESSAQHLWNG
jgi:hypothetical protein